MLSPAALEQHNHRIIPKYSNCRIIGSFWSFPEPYLHDLRFKIILLCLILELSVSSLWNKCFSFSHFKTAFTWSNMMIHNSQQVKVKAPLSESIGSKLKHIQFSRNTSEAKNKKSFLRKVTENKSSYKQSNDPPPGHACTCRQHFILQQLL